MTSAGFQIFRSFAPKRSPRLRCPTPRWRPVSRHVKALRLLADRRQQLSRSVVSGAARQRAAAWEGLMEDAPTLPPPASASGTSTTRDLWGSLHTDLVIQVAKAVVDVGGTLEGVLGTCPGWREARYLVAELRPLGCPPSLAAFPRAVSVDYSARGHAHNLTDAELAAACAKLGPRLERLVAGGAFQLSSAGMGALAACPKLVELVLDETTLEDEALEALRHLPRLRALSLRRCMFLRGGFLQTVAAACPQLQSLNLAGCGLSLHLGRALREALGSMGSLTQVDLSDGNGVSDEVVGELARLPRLASLRLRGAGELTDAGLDALAEAPCAATLHSLDISCCTRLTEGCWVPLARLAQLTGLDLEGLPHLLCQAPAPEPFSSALWRWQRLARLSLSGSCTHPAKLKLLAATCGATLEQLDLGAAPACTGAPLAAAAPSRAASAGAAGAAAVGPWGDPLTISLGAGGGVNGLGGTPGARRGGGTYRRLTPRQLEDLVEACGQLRSLRAFRAAGSGLAVEATLALLRAAPNLVWLDLAGCSLGRSQAAVPRLASSWHAFGAAARELSVGRPAAGAAAACTAAGAPSRAARALSFGAAALAGPSSAGGAAGDAAAAVAPLDAQGSLAAEEFAQAVARLGSLAGLSLAGCTGVTDRHLSTLGTLGALRQLSLADCRGVTDTALLGCSCSPLPAAAAEALGCSSQQAASSSMGLQALERLQCLDLSGTGVTDAGLGALSALAGLRQLSVARCAVSAAGLSALLGSAGGDSLGSNLRGLDLSRCCDVDDAALLLVASRCPALRWLRVSGCVDVRPAGLEAAARLLGRLTHLEVARCPHAITDATLAVICRHLTQLTHLDVSASEHLTTAGLDALSALPCLAQLDLTCCRGVCDEAARAALPALTRANVQMAGGSRSPTGSPIKQRRAAAS